MMNFPSLICKTQAVAVTSWQTHASAELLLRSKVPRTMCPGLDHPHDSWPLSSFPEERFFLLNSAPVAYT